jgi:hypothetical protein
VMAVARGRGWPSPPAARAHRGRPRGEAATLANGAGEGALRSDREADLACS